MLKTGYCLTLTRRKKKCSIETERQKTKDLVLNHKGENQHCFVVLIKY